MRTRLLTLLPWLSALAFAILSKLPAVQPSHIHWI